MNLGHYRTVIRLTLLTLTLFSAVSGFYWVVTAGVRRYLADHPFQVVGPGQFAPPAGKTVSGLVRKNSIRADQTGRHPIEAELLLLGTVAGGPKASFAIIKDRSLGSQGLYKLGQVIYGGTITEILREQVVIVSGSRRFVLTVQDDEEVGSNEGRGAIGVAADDIRDALGDLDRTLSQIDFQPYDADGGKGLEITNVAPGSIFDRFGLRGGDIVQRVNNVPIQNPQLFVALFARMKSLPVSLSFDNLDEEAVGVLTTLDPAAQGIGSEVASVVEKMKSGQDVALEFIRGGEVRRQAYRME